MPDPQQRDEEAEGAPGGSPGAPLDVGPAPAPRLLALERVDSTNAEARRRIEVGQASPGLLLTAREQTAGRGRRGRSWTTVPGRSLALSLVLADPGLERPARITLWAAVAACRALEAAGAPRLQVKWPNDVLRPDGAKVGGVLVEPVTDPAGARLLVVGLGLNLSLAPGDLPEGLEGRAGDAALAPTDELLSGVPLQLASELLEVAAEPAGPLQDQLTAEYVQRSWLDGRTLELSYRGRPETAVLAGLTPEGDLRLQDGRVLTGELVQLLAVR